MYVQQVINVFSSHSANLLPDDGTKLLPLNFNAYLSLNILRPCFSTLVFGFGCMFSLTVHRNTPGMLINNQFIPSLEMWHDFFFVAEV